MFNCIYLLTYISVTYFFIIHFLHHILYDLAVNGVLFIMVMYTTRVDYNLCNIVTQCNRNLFIQRFTIYFITSRELKSIIIICFLLHFKYFTRRFRKYIGTCCILLFSACKYTYFQHVVIILNIFSTKIAFLQKEILTLQSSWCIKMISKHCHVSITIFFILTLQL